MTQRFQLISYMAAILDRRNKQLHVKMSSGHNALENANIEGLHGCTWPGQPLERLSQK